MRFRGRTTRRALALAVLAAVLAGSTDAMAGPVNAERVRSNLDIPGWSGSLDATFGFARGNVNRLDLASNGLVQYQTVHPPGRGYGRGPAPEGAVPFFRHRWILTANNRFTTVSGAHVVNSGYTHARYTFMVLPRLGPEVFAQLQFNEFTLLRTRVLGGGGPRVVLVHRAGLRVWGATGYMAEYELNATEPGDPHPAEVVNHRWTSYLVARAMLAKGRVLVQNTAYVQPRLDAFSDLRILEAMQVQGQVTPVFSMGIDLQIQYDSRPPRTVETTDYTLGSYVKIGFG